MLGFSSCSSDPLPEAEPVKAKAVVAKPVWFNVPKRFSTPNRLGDIETHPFFDLNAYRIKDTTEVSYYLVTPKDSEHQYKLDMVSGQRYLRHTFCKHDDVWEEYEGSINKPNFAQGIIPRLMDQSGQPQQIWVFGDKTQFFTSKKELKVQSQRAIVIGGVVLQYCDNYPCKSNSEWLSRLVLIGINPFDKLYEGVKSLKDLKEKVDWEYTLAFAENGFGRNISGPLSEPAYRIGGEIDKKDVLDFAFENGHLFSFDEINSLRKNCFSLYDYIWKGQKLARLESQKRRKATDEYAKKYEKRAKIIRDLKSFQTRTVIDDNTRYQLDEDDKNLQNLEFEEFWLKLINKYSGRMKTCFDFVRPANSKLDRERTWFFAYVQNWINLEELGYFYSCSRRSWLENPMIAKGKRKYPKHETSGCSARDLDLGFEQAVTIMSSLSSALRSHYRFIEYDGRPGGSHELLFTWVPDNGKRLACDARALEEKESLFPEDISWKTFNSRKRNSRYDIIR
ncbi:MAG: hypothetical protein CME63_05990 [Halobacteriovoraceae bacterium]|nr:hypothetical protein [Halobacteriovoraceae bacterium]|tara:strand:+ start:2087 stop:3607 length:1521 start_codon:yes stop_codon:yes gene_type:complete